MTPLAVSGTWVVGRPRSTEPGILFYIMVDEILTTVDAVIAHGGVIVQQIGVDAPELTARFRDPAGNVIGLYQEPPGMTIALLKPSPNRVNWSE